MRSMSGKIVEEIKTHFMYKKVFSKIWPLMRQVKKYGTDEQATDENIIRRMRFAC